VNFNKPLFWHQGLFLQPQHFQYESLHSAQLNMQYTQYANSYPWGVAQLQFDDSTLSNGIIDIKKLDVIFEDGTFVSYPENVHLRGRSFEAQWTDRNKPLSVYLGISKLSANESNVTVVSNFDNAPEILTRYISHAEGENFQDLHQGDVTTPLKTMKYALRIFFGDEIDGLSDQVLIPIARVEQQGEELRYSNVFVAPSVSLKSSTVLLNNIKDIRDELIGRSKQIDSYKSTSTSRAAEFNPVAERYRSALRIIARYAPMLNHYFENSVVHPLEVYGQLRALIGELSTFSEKVNLLGDTPDGQNNLPRYQHTAIGECFDAAKLLIVNLLDELTVSPELLVRFERDESGRFSTDLTSEFFAKQHSMYFMLETSTHYGELSDSFNAFSKLGAQSVVDTYVQRAIPGIEFTHFPEQPTGLERRSKVTYFTIDRDSDRWKLVEEQGKIALQWDDAPADLVVEMVVVRG